MRKVKKLLNKLAISFALIGTLTAGAFFVGNKPQEEKVAKAEVSQYQQISNNLPEYMSITNEGEPEAGSVGDTVYLFNSNNTQNIVIGDEEITSPTENTKKNYGYTPDKNSPATYYYFDFQSSLSLYYDLTNEDIQRGMTGTNLLNISGITISNFTQTNSLSFTLPDGYSFTPQMFDLRLKFNTNQQDISVSGNSVTLNQEGCYTLAIPTMIYKTENNGITFTGSEATIYYTFMIFNSDTYFNEVTGTPNITPSTNLQQSNLSASSAYSTYYFYNYAYGRAINTLPTISYNLNRFELSVEYTDIEEQIFYTRIVYSSGILKQLDKNGNEILEKDRFLQSSIKENNAVLTFTDLGSYDLSIKYLYVSSNGNNTTTYNVPLEQLKNNDIFKNKSQKLYVYGYQAVYSDYSNINPETNQPENKALTTYDFESNTYGYDAISDSYTNSADITSSVNDYIINNTTEASDKSNAQMQNPSKDSAYQISTLKDYALSYINSNNIKPISTNQTPIKFLTNAKLDSKHSNIYRLKSDGSIEESSFTGLNQNTEGTYLYIIQYTFDSFLSTSGTAQSGYYHYQIFYFKVTNNTPTVTVYDSDFSEIYTEGFTNKSVYILNDAENNIFDSEVEIKLSAYDYTRKSYFFRDRNIKDLESYGIEYEKFEESSNPEKADFNTYVATKQGVLIKKDSQYANAKFTIQIFSPNSEQPSERTFTIDTTPIQNIKARNAFQSSSTTFKIEEDLTSYSTNKPFILSWDEKASNATTYGYIKYIPITEINYYSSLNETQLSTLLSRLINTGKEILPVSYMLDMKSASGWSEYANSVGYTSKLPSTYAKANDGIYILEVYDQAGNNSFEIFLKDSTSPVFIQEIIGDSTIRKLISNGETISIPEENVDIKIRWMQNKAIYINKIEEYSNFEAYKYGINAKEATENLKKTLSNFFNSTSNITEIDNINIPVTGTTGIDSYNSDYLIIPINETAFIKDALSSNYKKNQINTYEIDFLDDNNQAIEGTYKILLRDSSNNQFSNNEENNFKLFPSGYLSFTVTSDASKMMVKYKEGETLDYSSYNLTGNLYKYKDAKGNTIYTQLSNNGLDKDSNDYVAYEKTSLAYKYQYHTPTRGNKEITLSYIPIAENGSKIDSINLYYYPYELKYTVINGNYHYYYSISETASKTKIFPLSEKVYSPGETESFAIALGTDEYPLAGRYVVERIYVEGNNTDKYDYFRRTITFIVDNFNLISETEGVTNENGDSSLESIVGGDIVLSMYSGENLSSFEVSFPSYKENGLNTGSFYTKDSFTEDENIPKFAVSGNKLPVSLYIPQYKYTISTSTMVSEDDQKQYFVEKNPVLSYYGNAYYKINSETGLFDVYVEGVVVNSFGKEEQAIEYISKNTSIVEYEIFARIEANITDSTGKKISQIYYSNGSATGGYLNFYLLDSNGKLSTQPTEFFFNKGEYVVTIYQSRNDTQSNAYSMYKFGFEIISQEPDFTIYGSDGFELIKPNENQNHYYTNSSNLTVEWQIPTSKYHAKIDIDSIIVTPYNSSNFPTRSEIKDGIGTKYFTLDTSDIVLEDGSYIEISMKYEGFNDDYYNVVTKRIYFDISAPTRNLTELMLLTERATSQAFNVNYQQYFMRKYYNHNGQEISVSVGTDLSKLSYSYSQNNGYFKYYSYNVTTDFFDITLKESLINSHILDSKFIYYKQIPDIKAYTQVDKSSFDEGNGYLYIDQGEEAEVVCGYYEIVELDYAGNMTVYIVNVIDSKDKDDPNVRTDALSYRNNTHENDITIENDQIIDGFNIYSNTGFEITNFNYKSDDWAILNVTISGRSLTRYMKSPWLEENTIYKLSFKSSGIDFEQVSLSTLFEDVSSTNNKHQLVFADRIEGKNITTYLSIMDASIITQKVEDPERLSAILNISVPAEHQQSSTDFSYVFPTKITIQMFVENKWNTIMIANQAGYGVWVPETNYETALDYIKFNTSGNTLQIVLHLGVNASQKVKYEILDNFGNTTTQIQLANEVSYKEISGNSPVYSFNEQDGSFTYISSNTIKYSYNTLLYTVAIYDKNGADITSAMAPNKSHNATTNISVYSFSPSSSKTYNDYYKIVVKDVENPNDPNPKIIHLKLIYNLPFLTFNSAEVNSGGILFSDKNQKPIDNDYVKYIQSMSVNFNGRTYTSSAYTISTHSQNVTVRFRNGQDFAFEGAFAYQNDYSYSVYLSRDGGNSWENINNPSSAVSGYTISGVGNYKILIKYDSDTIFDSMCKIFDLTIISESEYYSVKVDALEIDPSNIKYKNNSNVEYEINYIVSVDYYTEKNSRITITHKEDVTLNDPQIEYKDSGIVVEIYHYASETGISGDFTIIYIPENTNFVTTFTYDSSVGTTVPLKGTTAYKMIESAKNTDFSKLKINFSSFYGIKENIINAKISKLFNGSYVEIECKIYQENNYSYFYLDRAGSYRIQLFDSCSPANIQRFGTKDYIDIDFLSSVPFLVSYQTETGEIVTTEAIQKAIYNTSITIEPSNLYSDSYYQRIPTISAKLNGVDYTGYEVNNRKYIFSEPGFYSIKFSAVSKGGVELREEEFNFSIVKKNELKSTYEFSQYSKYFIEKVEKNGVDITSDLINIGNFKTVIVNGQEYLSALSISHSLLDEKTGDGRYKITVNLHNNAYKNVIGERFTFELRIGHVTTLPINVSIKEGQSTTGKITVSFNAQNLYEAAGDCYVQVGNQKLIITAETLANYSEITQITISNTGTYYIQVFSISGRPLYSYKVIKTEPLNAFAIIAIIFGVIAFAVIIGITISIRKRQKIK